MEPLLHQTKKYNTYLSKMVRQRDQIHLSIFDFRTNNYYTFEEFMFIYDIPDSDFLKYETLVNSIPVHYKTLCDLRNIGQYNYTSFLQKVQKYKNVSKYLNTIQKDKTENKTKQQLKWDRIMRDYDFDWKKANTISYKSSTDITLRNWQFI